MTARIVSVVALCVIMGSCSKETTTAPSTTSTVYNYTGTDSTGVTIVLGTLSIQVFDSAKMSGSWNLASANGASSAMFGPQFGSGSWQGTRTLVTLLINLNPGVVDDNVVLNGTAVYANPGDQAPASFRGDWQFVTLHGISNHGSFLATRK